MEAQEPTTRLSDLSDVPTYNVKAVCRWTGITAATLRAWERRYGLPSPNRNLHGYRLYSERDVAILFWLIQHTSTGLNIGQAVQQLSHILDSEQDPVMKLPAHPVRATQEAGPRSPDLIVDEVVHALLAMDERRADTLISEALALYTLETVLVMILRSALADVREAHARGQTTTTVEHFTSNYLRQRVLSVTHTSPNAKAPPSVVIVGFASERNELDLLILSTLLRRNGFPVTHLGAELEPTMLTNELPHLHAGVVLFYTDNVINAASLVKITIPLLSAVYPVRMVIAGEALDAAPELQALIGVEYLGNDLRQIVRDLIDGLRRVPQLAVARR